MNLKTSSEWDQNRRTFQMEATAQSTGLMQAGRSIITTVLCQRKTENSNMKTDGYVDSIDDNEKVTYTPHEAYGTESVKTRTELDSEKSSGSEKEFSGNLNGQRSGYASKTVDDFKRRIEAFEKGKIKNSDESDSSSKVLDISVSRSSVFDKSEISERNKSDGSNKSSGEIKSRILAFEKGETRTSDEDDTKRKVEDIFLETIF